MQTMGLKFKATTRYEWRFIVHVQLINVSSPLRYLGYDMTFTCFHKTGLIVLQRTEYLKWVLKLLSARERLCGIKK